MGKVWFVALVFVLIATLSATPAGAVKYVKWNAPGPVHDGSSWSKAFLTIQEGLDVAVDGERVLVAGTPDTLSGNTEPGTIYAERIVFKSTAILEGGYRGNYGPLPDLTRNPKTYVTIIDGGATDSGTQTVTAAANASIDGFTIQGAETAVYINTGANTVFTVKNNIVQNGSQYGIYLVDCDPVITGNIISGRSSGKTGVYCIATTGSNFCNCWSNTSAAVITGNTVEDWVDFAVQCEGAYGGCWRDCLGNCVPKFSGNALSGAGWTVYVHNCSPEFVGNSISHSAAGNAAIRLFSDASSMAPVLQGNVIQANGSMGIQCEASGWTDFCNVHCSTLRGRIESNTISGSCEYGIHCSSSLIKPCGSSCTGTCIPEITKNVITGLPGSGIYLTSYSNAKADGNWITGCTKGITCAGVPATITNNTLCTNQEEGILCNGGSTAIIAGNYINGGNVGIRCSGVSATHTSPSVSRNTVTDSGIAVILQMSDSKVDSNLFAYCWDAGVNIQGGSAKVYNNTVVKNAVYGINVESGMPAVFNNIVSGNGVGYLDVAATGTLDHNNFWDNDMDYYGVSKPASDTAVDPMFLAPSVGEYHLLPGSPCIEMGSNTYVTSGDKDADGKDRILPAEGTVDMGCFEWEDPTTVPYLIRSANQAKVVPSQYGVQLKGKVVSAAWDNSFYLEDDDLKSGIRVEKAAHSLTGDNQRATVTGNVQVNSSGERFIQASSVAASGVGSVKPLGVNGRSIGGGSFMPAGIGQQGVLGGAGVNNIGLLVRVWGRVTEVEPVTAPVQPTWIKIDDGSGRQIKCAAEGGSPVINPLWLDDYMMVTGISSCEFDGTDLVSIIRIKKTENPITY